MGWTFKVHGGVAAALGTVLLVLATLTWLPGAQPLTGLGWLLVAMLVLLFPISVSALVRVIRARAAGRSVWRAFRCLPGKAQLALGALAVWGGAMLILGTAGEGDVRAAETRDGGDFYWGTMSDAPGTIVLSQSQYHMVLENDQRSMLTISGLLFVGAACAVLTAGELRRAGRGSLPS